MPANGVVFDRVDTIHPGIHHIELGHMIRDKRAGGVMQMLLRLDIECLALVEIQLTPGFAKE